MRGRGCLPESDGGCSPITDSEAQAHLVLGLTELALVRYRSLLARYERLAASEPNRADYQRDLFVSHYRMAAVDPSNALAHNTRVHGILADLKAKGRMNPVDKPHLQRLAKRLAQLRAGSAS